MHYFEDSVLGVKMAAKKKEELQEEKKLSVEEAFAAIEDKIEALDSEDISLEDSFKEYQEGMKLLKYCHEAIEAVEQKVQKIAEDGSLEDFE
jgi:exodeoxyribonuclease VII small subunit